MATENLLWGTGAPQFIFFEKVFIMGMWLEFPTILKLPQPSEYIENFIPDDIPHKTITGIRPVKLRGYYLDHTLYYDLIRHDTAVMFKQIIDASRNSQYGILFMPHSDYTLNFRVRVNESEGWNFTWVMKKITHGYEGHLHIKGAEWLPLMPPEKPAVLYPGKKGMVKLPAQISIKNLIKMS